MKNAMKYKGYIGSVEFSEEDERLFGKVQGIKALISYEGTDVRSLQDDFHEAVDDYLVYCEEKNIEPEKAYKGSFNVRIPPELHRKAVYYADARHITLNELVTRAIKDEVGVRGIKCKVRRIGARP